MAAGYAGKMTLFFRWCPVFLLSACADSDKGWGAGGGSQLDSSGSGADSGADSALDGALADPPLDDSSHGSGGSDAALTASLRASGVDYLLLAPTGSATGRRRAFLLVIAGAEGASGMMNNLQQVAEYGGIDNALIAVVAASGTTGALTVDDAAIVLDAVRSSFDVDNDRTWLLSEGTGTRVGLELGLQRRAGYFAAYWANDVDAQAATAQPARALGFAPWGNVGPGGDAPDASAIVAAMQGAGWQTPPDSPYSGSGSTSFGSEQQFLAAVGFFFDKARN